MIYSQIVFMFKKKFIFYFIFLLKINIFLIFLDNFDILMLKTILKK
jgi:hypothetical protein